LVSAYIKSGEWKNVTEIEIAKISDYASILKG